MLCRDEPLGTDLGKSEQREGHCRQLEETGGNGETGERTETRCPAVQGAV